MVASESEPESKADEISGLKPGARKRKEKEDDDERKSKKLDDPANVSGRCFLKPRFVEKW